MTLMFCTILEGKMFPLVHSVVLQGDLIQHRKLSPEHDNVRTTDSRLLEQGWYCHRISCQLREGQSQQSVEFRYPWEHFLTGPPKDYLIHGRKCCCSIYQLALIGAQFLWSPCQCYRFFSSRGANDFCQKRSPKKVIVSLPCRILISFCLLLSKTYFTKSFLSLLNLSLYLCFSLSSP